ncbi:hypothetical protein Ahy_B02g060093 isoform A [Arachis hypogaea]|uniref:Uncharacterized protein n=1 Tax=Arachis hypogaea TaxID=3818 RepID=A0A445AHX4_ARAHY|nr:hypothetical protein Ahy_B02g060093 isoform A [Arachis hypogaea]
MVINEILHSYGKTLKDYPLMPLVTEVDNIVILSSNQIFDELIPFSYPNILKNMSSKYIFKARTILFLTLKIVEEVDNHLMAIILGGEKLYLSSNLICMNE